MLSILDGSASPSLKLCCLGWIVAHSETDRLGGTSPLRRFTCRRGSGEQRPLKAPARRRAVGAVFLDDPGQSAQGSIGLAWTWERDGHIGFQHHYSASLGVARRVLVGRGAAEIVLRKDLVGASRNGSLAIAGCPLHSSFAHGVKTAPYSPVAQALSLPTRHSCRVLFPARHQASRRVSTRQPERLRHGNRILRFRGPRSLSGHFTSAMVFFRTP